MLERVWRKGNPTALMVGMKAGAADTIYHRLELEPSQRDPNQHGWDSNPAKTHGTWFQDLMKLRFFMSHHIKNSVRNKVIVKKWIYSDTERSTLHRARAIADGKHSPEIWPG